MSRRPPNLRIPGGCRGRLRAAARAEGGFMLVELLMSSVLVALIAVGLYTAIVGSSRGAANDRYRSIAAALAQQDQERMRAFKPSSLSNYRETRSVTVAGTTYTVESRGQWVTDSSGVLSCASGTGAANYLLITSTTSWPSMGSLKPITVRSLVAPSSGLTASKGSLTVKITDQATNPLTNQSTSITGPGSHSETTDSDGCAVYSAIDPGNYTLSFSRSGYVDVGGNSSVSKTVSVTAGATTTETVEYAQAGAIAVSFDTQIGTNPVQASQSQYVRVSHSNLPAPGYLTFDPPGGAQSTINATSLFPFTSAYGVYAGNCPANDPVTYDANYYQANAGAVTVAPGGSHAVTVRTPAIRIRTLRGGTTTAGMYVLVKITSSGCTETFAAQTSNSSFALPNPGFPFGTYQVCADSRFQTGTTRRRTVTGIANTNPAGTPVVHDVDVPTSGFSSIGLCT